MMRTSIRLAILVACLVGSARAEEPRPVISIRAVHPDRQVREVIDLFDGVEGPSSGGGPGGLEAGQPRAGPAGQAARGADRGLQPGMADELRTLDGAEVALWFEPEDGRLAWGVSLPGDDGTFQALASAMVLSGGRSETRPGEPPADRLGGPGSPLMARGPRGSLIAGSFEDLRVVRERAEDA